MEPIPWYRSNVLRALLVGIVAFILKAAGLADQFPDAEHYVAMVLDLVQLVAGFWAAWARIRQPNPPVTVLGKKPPNVQPVLAALTLMLLSVPLLHGCGSLGIARAQTVEQKAAALLGDFTLYQKASLQIGNDATVVPEVRKGVLDAAIAAKPAADSLDDALRQYRQMKIQLEAGTTTDAKVAIAAANLSNWIEQVRPLVTQLRKLVEGATK